MAPCGRFRSFRSSPPPKDITINKGIWGRGLEWPGDGVAASVMDGILVDASPRWRRGGAVVVISAAAKSNDRAATLLRAAARLRLRCRRGRRRDDGDGTVNFVVYELQELVEASSVARLLGIFILFSETGLRIPDRRWRTRIADALVNNNMLRDLILHLENLENSYDYTAFTHTLCNNASILSTYQSNHSLVKLSYNVRPLLENLISLLRINRENSTSQAARIKIIKYMFVQLPLLGWVEMAEAMETEIFCSLF